MRARLDDLRRHAVAHSLFPPTSLDAAIERLGFVQADPIRAPARAQDLILRHRVADYRAGDLEEHYSDLDIEEDFFYVYGFLPRKTWEPLQPRASGRLTVQHRRLLAAFRENGTLHPKELAARFGRERAINLWGGYSRSTQLGLADLHARGLLRVARRDKGTRIYEVAPATARARLPAAERLARLTMVVAGLLAPVPRGSLREVVNRIRRRIAAPETSSEKVIQGLLKDEQLIEADVDGMPYVWPSTHSTEAEAPPRVRFLAPFDPLVWDRRRFEHFWAWPYRFEAYTPRAKRERGYYAMPLLWRNVVVGWANVTSPDGRLDVELGFVDARPSDSRFDAELADEIGRLEHFLDRKDARSQDSRPPALTGGPDA